MSQTDTFPPTYPAHYSVRLLPEQEKLLSHVSLALTGSRHAAVLNVTIITHPAVPFLWCNRVGGKTLNRTAVAGGQLSSGMFGKDHFAVYTSLPTVQKAINTWPLFFHFWYLYKQQKGCYKLQKKFRLISVMRVVYPVLMYQNQQCSVLVAYWSPFK